MSVEPVAPRRQGARLLHRRGTPSAAPPRCTRCSGATRRSSCPTPRSRGSSSPELRSRNRKPSDLRPETLERTPRCSRPRVRTSVLGEASPSYLMSHTAAAPHRRGAAARAHRRDPARARRPSCARFHLQCVRNHVETETDFATALALEPATAGGEQIPRHCARPHALLYSDHVRYVEQLRRFLAVFAREQVLVLIYDDFRADNEATVRRVLRFLEVDDGAPVEAVEANPSVRVRYRRLHELTHELSLGPQPAHASGQARDQGITSSRLRRQALRVTRRRVVFGEPRAARRALMAELRRRFRGEVAALSEYLGRDLVTSVGLRPCRLSRPQGSGCRGRSLDSRLRSARRRPRRCSPRSSSGSCPPGRRRGGSPISSSSATPRAGPPRCTRCCAATHRSICR